MLKVRRPVHVAGQVENRVRPNLLEQTAQSFNVSKVCLPPAHALGHVCLRTSRNAMDPRPQRLQTPAQVEPDKPTRAGD